MILPYIYHGFTIEGFYDEPKPDEACTFSVYIESINSEFCQPVASGVANWTAAKAQAERAIDALIASQK